MFWAYCQKTQKILKPKSQGFGKVKKCGAWVSMRIFMILVFNLLGVLSPVDNRLCLGFSLVSLMELDFLVKGVDSSFSLTGIASCFHRPLFTSSADVVHQKSVFASRSTENTTTFDTPVHYYYLCLGLKSH